MIEGEACNADVRHGSADLDAMACIGGGIANANADTLVGFVSGADEILAHGNDVLHLGPNGDFAAGDQRFAAGAGFTSGRDATDRIIYNTTTGQLFYDGDGNGAGAAQLIATLQGAPTLASTDISVDGSNDPMGVVGTEGNDSLEGGPGNDTIDGRGGNDTISGYGGDDSILGGTGDDNLLGGEGGVTFRVSRP